MLHLIKLGKYVCGNVITNNQQLINKSTKENQQKKIACVIEISASINVIKKYYNNKCPMSMAYFCNQYLNRQIAVSPYIIGEI